MDYSTWVTTHSSILAWRIPWTERSLTGYSPCGCKSVRYDLMTKQQQLITNTGLWSSRCCPLGLPAPGLSSWGSWSPSSLFYVSSSGLSWVYPLTLAPFSVKLFTWLSSCHIWFHTQNKLWPFPTPQPALCDCSPSPPSAEGTAYLAPHGLCWGCLSAWSTLSPLPSGFLHMFSSQRCYSFQ